MYAGHAAVALALKAREPRMPIVPLTIACYGPDWLQWLLGLFIERPEMSPHTHSVSAVIVAAFAAAGAYALLMPWPGAKLIFAGWLLHWPADFLTGRKPFTGLEDMVGLQLYARPLVDFVLEAALIGIGCVIYGRVYAQSGERRWVVAGLCVALVVAQGAMDLSIVMGR